MQLVVTGHPSIKLYRHTTCRSTTSDRECYYLQWMTGIDFNAGYWLAARVGPTLSTYATGCYRVRDYAWTSRDTVTAASQLVRQQTEAEIAAIRIAARVYRTIGDMEYGFKLPPGNRAWGDRIFTTFQGKLGTLELVYVY